MSKTIFLFGKLRKVVVFEGEEGVWFTFRGKKFFKPLRVLLKTHVSQPVEPSPELTRYWQRVLSRARLPTAVRMLRRKYPPEVLKEGDRALTAWLDGDDPYYLEKYIRGEWGNVLVHGYLSELQALSQAVYLREGKKFVRVYRGLSVDQVVRNLDRLKHTRVLNTRILTSFSESPGVARSFSDSTGLVIVGTVPVSKVRFSWRVLKELFRRDEDYFGLLDEEKEIILSQLHLPLNSIRFPRNLFLAKVSLPGYRELFLVKRLHRLDDYFKTLTTSYKNWGQLINECDYIVETRWEKSGASVFTIVPRKDWQKFLEDYPFLNPYFVELGTRSVGKLDLQGVSDSLYKASVDMPIYLPPELFKVVRRRRFRGKIRGWISIEFLQYSKPS